uniref:Uncharacterized protein n=1 Tax=Anopheles culicifacies TaxID=139723 RepID=A0A182M1P1_9DIPT
MNAGAAALAKLSKPKPAGSILQTVPAAAPPIVDPLPLCLDANGTYLCTSYNPRCYIIQKLTPTPVSCITYEVTPIAAPLVAQPTVLTAASNLPASSAAAAGPSIQTIGSVDELLTYNKTPLVTTVGGSGLELTTLAPDHSSSGSNNQHHHYTNEGNEEASATVAEAGSLISVVNRIEGNRSIGKSSNNHGQESGVNIKVKKEQINSSSRRAAIHAPTDTQAVSVCDTGSASAIRIIGGSELLSAAEVIRTDLDENVTKTSSDNDSNSFNHSGSAVSCANTIPEQQQHQISGGHRASNSVVTKVQRKVQTSGAAGSMTSSSGRVDGKCLHCSLFHYFTNVQYRMTRMVIGVSRIQ